MARPRGMTYLMVLWWVAISSVVLAALGQQWAMEARRQRDLELAFRGNQIRQALTDYYNQAPEGQPKLLPSRLEDLLLDPRQAKVVRHLRQLWPDPITGQAWGLIREGPYIKGVYSTAQRKPVRAPEGVESYEQWRFEFGQAAERIR
ncbi:MAG: type II secretion system protein [Acidobacteriota bacterium]